MCTWIEDSSDFASHQRASPSAESKLAPAAYGRVWLNESGLARDAFGIAIYLLQYMYMYM